MSAGVSYGDTMACGMTFAVFVVFVCVIMCLLLFIIVIGYGKYFTGGEQGHAPFKTFSLQQSLFCVSVEFYGDRPAIIKMR